MSSSITQVVTPSTDPNLLQWKGCLDDLSSILSTYKNDWKDPLSRKVSGWIVSVCRDAVDMSSNTGSLHKSASSRVDDLASRILVCTIDGGLTPLTDPLLDHTGKTWEKKNLQMYLGFSSLGPDGKKMEVIDHLFAKSMLEWVKTTPYASSAPSSALVAISLQEDMLKMMLFGQMAQGAALSLAFQQMSTKCKAVQDLCVQKEKVIRDSCAAEIKRVETLEIARTAHLTHKIDTMVASFDDTVAKQQGRIDVVTQKADALDKTLGQTEERLARTEIDLKYSQSDLDAAKREIEHLKQVIEDMEDDSMCVLA